MMQQGPGSFRVADFGKHPIIPIMYEAGFRQMIGGPLTYGEEAIGMLSFNSPANRSVWPCRLPPLPGHCRPTGRSGSQRAGQ